MTFTIERREFAKRDGTGLDGTEPTGVERARADGQAQLVERRASLRLCANLAVGPLRQVASASASAPLSA